MTFKFPVDKGGDPDCQTRLIEEEGRFLLHFEGENTPANDYRENRRTDGSRGYGETKEWREIGFVSNAEALTIFKLTGINLFSGDKAHTEAFLKLLNGNDFVRLKTIEGGVSEKIAK